MTRKRKLRDEELQLWQQVARTADPLHPGRDAPAETPVQTLTSRTAKEQKDPKPVPMFKIGEKHPSRNETHVPVQSMSERLAQAPVQMDSKAFGRLKRGKLVPEARLDLHGMTLNEAHPELVRFVLNAHTRGLRLVLVITGKGQRPDPHDPMPLRRGVLKQQVPLWMRSAPLAQVILQVSEAHVRHGGGGAYYVYLKRRR